MFERHAIAPARIAMKRRQFAKERFRVVTALFVASTFVLIAGVLRWWMLSPSRQLSLVEGLLREAYTSQRTFELRLPDAGYATVQANPQRDDSSTFSKPIALLDAESRISQQMAKNPDDGRWLRLRARAEMLRQNYNDAISILNRAIDSHPDDMSLLADMGTAYALRSEAENRDVDYGYAIEYMGRSLKAKPFFPEVVFNRAVVYERMYLFEDAVRDWQRYLEMDPAGAWTAEAHRRLADLQRKKQVQESALSRISNDPENLLRRILDADDIEPETYLDEAVIDWLPRRWEGAKYERALDALATRFETRHKDRWLRDVLARKRSELLATGLATLSEAVRANLADESDRALAKSAAAAEELRAAGSESGALRAEFEQTYALHRTLQSSAECLQRAVALERKRDVKEYSWIRAQAILEEGNCYGLLGDYGAAQREMARALQVARVADYRDLSLRAAGILANHQGVVEGNLLAAWNLAREGLATYWSGSHPGIRAQQIYFTLFGLSENLGLHEAAYVFERAAAMAITGTTHHRSEATARAHLAQLAVDVGRPGEAKAELDRAATLFDQLQQASDRPYRMLATLSRAEADASAGALEAALQRLEEIRPAAEKVFNAQDRINFYQVLGELLQRGGRANEAERAYREAIALSERSLNTVQGTRDRAQFLPVNGKAYRGLVELLCERKDLTEGLRVWEWFRAAEEPGPRGEPDLEQLRARLTNESFLTYAILPGRAVAWVVDDQGIEGRRLNVKMEELEAVASRFLRECADPASERRAVRRDARKLYGWLVAPLVHRLDPARTLVIEPDGPVGAIPMQALMDQSFHYLGERFPISIAGGLADYQRRESAGPVNAGLKALVVGSPKLGEKMSKTFPPLPGIMREARSVAERFSSAVLLVGEQPTLQAVEQHRAGTELFHFAGHGFSNAGNGGLLLSPSDSDAEGAGILDGPRMAQQDWTRCRLAVLSACSTGTGETRGPVNPESLVRGLLWAGVARVVASRWNVDSETSVRFMDQFYTDLLSVTRWQLRSKTLRSNSGKVKRRATPIFGWDSRALGSANGDNDQPTRSDSCKRMDLRKVRSMRSFTARSLSSETMKEISFAP